MADEAKLLAVIDANTKAFENALKRVQGETNKTFGNADRSVRRLNTSLNASAASASRFGRNFGLAFTAAGAIALASSAIRKFLTETAESEASVAQLNAALISTGGAAGATSKELQDLASSLASVTVFEDDAILGVESLLLAFRKISRDVLPEATAAVLDISTRLKIDLGSAAKLVGKAFEDPAKGVNALRKAGVILSPALVTIITHLTKTGELTKAQNLLLRELETSYGGAAIAARETLGGALTALSVAWGELFEVSGPASDKLRVAVENLITAISKPEFKEAVQTIGVDLVDALVTLADIAPDFISRVGGMGGAIIGLGHDARTAVDNIGELRNVIREWMHLPAVKSDIGIGDIDKQIESAHKLADALKPNVELLTALQKKLSIAPGTPAAGGGNDDIDDTAAAEEALAAQIQAEADSQAEAARQRKRAADELKRQKEAVKELISDLEFENKLIGLSDVEREKEIQLRRAGAAATQTQRDQIVALVTAGAAEQKSLDALIDRMDEVRDAAGGALSSFVDSLREGQGLAAGLKAALDSVLDAVIRIAEQKFIASLFGAPGTPGLGILSSAFGGGGGGGGVPVVGGGGGGSALTTPSLSSRIGGTTTRAAPGIINLHINGAVGNTEVREMAAAGTMEALAAYDRHLPARVRGVVGRMSRPQVIQR